MKPDEFLVLHFEDQPQYISFIPQSLAIRIGRMGCPASCASTSDEETFTIKIECSSGPPLTLRYLIRTEQGDFMEQFNSSDGNKLIILDLIRGQDIEFGLSVYNKLKDRLAGTSLLWLTAYPEEVADAIGWNPHDRRVIAKNASRIDLIDRILAQIQINWPTASKMIVR